MIGLAALAAAAPQTIQFARKYSVGDVDSYHMKLNMAGETPLDIELDLTQKVMKVYDNGDADLESSMTNGKATMMGQEGEISIGQPVVSRFSKQGYLVEAEDKASDEPEAAFMFMDVMKYTTRLPKEGLAVGQTIALDEAGAASSKIRVKGTTKLESLEDGVGKLHTSMDVTSARASGPIHFDVTTWVESASSKIRRIEGKVTDLEGVSGLPPQMKIETIKFLLERKP